MPVRFLVTKMLDFQRDRVDSPVSVNIYYSQVGQLDFMKIRFITSP